MHSFTTDLARGISLRRLAEGFILTLNSEGKSPQTVAYYEGNLGRFLWYAERQSFPQDTRLVTQWHIRDFLQYVVTATHRWGLSGNGSESSTRKAGPQTVWHYFRSLRTFFNWTVAEGLIEESPMARIHMKAPRPPVIQPYTEEQLQRMLDLCELDYRHNAKFLGSRNKALVMVFVDTGLRLCEMAAVRLGDINRDRGLIKVQGKSTKQRVVRMGIKAQKALWRYMLHRPDNGEPWLWLTEEGRQLRAEGIQQMVQRLLVRSGLAYLEGCVHKFRHTFAINFLRNGGGMPQLQYLLGHSTLEMTKRYVATLGLMDALSAHEKASPLDGMDLA